MFKLYLYGIEISEQVKKVAARLCSNCTFMELKSRTEKIIYNRLVVQIVPLWN